MYSTFHFEKLKILKTLKNEKLKNWNSRICCYFSTNSTYKIHKYLINQASRKSEGGIILCWWMIIWTLDILVFKISPLVDQSTFYYRTNFGYIFYTKKTSVPTLPTGMKHIILRGFWFFGEKVASNNLLQNEFYR